MRSTTTRALVLACLAAACNGLAKRNTQALRHTQASNTTVVLTTKQQRDLQTVTAWNQLGGDLFGEGANFQSGFAVSMSQDGSRMAVGSPQNNAGGTNAGKVRIYEYRTNGGWTLIGTLLGTAGAGAGQAVGMSGDGNTVCVGSFRLSPFNGQVQIYRWNNGSWRRLIQLDGRDTRDRFGAAISLNHDGTRVAIGAAFHNGRGKTEIWEQSAVDTEWTIVGEINGANVGDMNGHSAALSSDGTTVAIGELTADPGNIEDAGTVAVFQSTSAFSGWNQLGVDIPGVATNEQSGYSVAISEDGSIVAIGSPKHSFQASESGMVRVFRYNANSNSWEQMGLNIYPETPRVNGRFGTSVSLSLDGLVLAVGEPYATNLGKAGIYFYAANANNPNAGTWTKDITLSAGAVADRFGYSVALAGVGTRLAVGAYSADRGGAADSGVTRVYEFQTADWILSVEDFQTNFASGTLPEFTLKFQGVAPATASAARSYRQSILLPSCALGPATNTAITPKTPAGTVPSQTSFELTTEIDVDLDTIRGSGYFSEVSVGRGNMAFCVKTEIMEGSEVKAERLADITLDLDMGQDFLVRDFISRDPTTGKTDIRDQTKLDYAFTHFFCDQLGNDISGGTSSSVAPGGTVSVCLRANAGEPVVVTDLKSVSFQNFLAPLLGVPLIDDAGVALHSSTTKDCSSPTVCRISAITVPRLYEYMDSSGNVQDVTAGVSMEGIVTFAFPNRRLQGGAPEVQDSLFRIQLDLAKPPDRTDYNNRQSSSADSSFRALWLVYAAPLSLAWFFLSRC